MWPILIAILLAVVIGILILFCINYCCCRITKKKSTSNERRKIKDDQTSWVTQIDSDEDVENAINIDEREEKSSFLEPRTNFEDENDYEICVPANNDQLICVPANDDQLKPIVIVLQLLDTKNVELQPVPFENNADFEPNQRMNFQGE